MIIDLDMVVDQVMQQWPATIRVFLDFKMGCVGCPIACFHTVEDTCREHGADHPSFLAALRQVAAPLNVKSSDLEHGAATPSPSLRGEGSG
jgi:hybrid cluster-associated redox disulfide protein